MPCLLVTLRGSQATQIMPFSIILPVNGLRLALQRVVGLSNEMIASVCVHAAVSNALLQPSPRSIFGHKHKNYERW